MRIPDAVECGNQWQVRTHLARLRAAGPHARLRVSDGMSEGSNVGALTQRCEAQVSEEGDPRRDSEISHSFPTSGLAN